MIRHQAPSFSSIISQSLQCPTEETLQASKLKLAALQESAIMVKKLAQTLEKTSLKVKKKQGRSRSPNNKQAVKTEPNQDNES